MADLDQKRRAVEPYLKFLRRLDDDVDLDTRVGHILDEYTGEDVTALAATLDDVGVTAGFSVPAVHLEERDAIRAAVGDLADEGHEVLLHGYRHTSFLDVPYETAVDELSRASEVLTAVTGREPTGFHVPYGAASEGALEAASELGVEWIVGSGPDTVDGDEHDLTLMQPSRPYDLQLLERGVDPVAAFERLSDNAEADSVFLCHPNVHFRPGASEAFVDWLAVERPSSPAAVAANPETGPGLLLDCFPPFRVA